MKPISLKFDGQVIEELSTKIPSNIFALNELTKNSYDAFAKNVSITIDINNSRLIISDDGVGMNEEDINKLFHIAFSKKKYGSKVSFNGMERYVQGAKGLGFLSVFKFGDNVTWKTYNKGKKIQFSVDKQDLISKNNVSRFKFLPEVTDEPGIGTTISIDMNENDLEALNSYFQEKKNTAKTVNAFYDKTLEISLETNSGCYKTTDFNEHLDEAEDLQFCAVRYSSSSSKILIYRLGSLVKTCDFKISSRNYSVDLDLNIYHFNSGGKKKISELFYREPDEALSPLLFINDNLFNNFTIFDSNINRAKRSAESMPQMIGYVRVYSSNKDLDFNSDRTNFVENELTRKIENDLMNLNRKIQEVASSLKAQGKSEDAIVITGKARSDTEDIVDHTEEDILSAAKINLKNNLERRYQIPSSQIDLKKFISSAIDSYGEPIPFDKLNYFEEGKNILPILSSVDIECVKNIKISFLDSRTGLVIENLKLEFFSPKATITGKSRKELFTFFSNKSYTIKMPCVANLINQASDLYKTPRTNFNDVIACSLRAILELSCDYLQQEFPNIFTYDKPSDKVYCDDLLWKVSQVIFFVKSDKKAFTTLSKSIAMSYHSLNNYLDMPSYHLSVKNAHLGAHKSTFFISPDEIKSLAQRAGLFAVICDALLYRMDNQVVNNIPIDRSSFK